MTKTVLVLCTGNSCRSQMAEGFWNQLGEGAWTAYSAGSAPSGYVHPKAIEVMGEIGIDISKNESKHLDQYLTEKIDIVVTVCDNAKESCPIFPGAREVLHWPFEDPADFEGDEASTLQKFREIRDQIQSRIKDYLTLEHIS
ncbi:MAG: arsenate reductase ArsC [Candidatus Eisenbacteria bacterium]|uniref:Arsenate reductase ArsC n=1 Tax=Eiseniibacteriota bacterium TaxID=2212470 RepID=A0A7Y2E8P2_UNCEI|nr:arsenate reductase ArsC [Candidatus Eisenbacteria bacterium]